MRHTAVIVTSSESWLLGGVSIARMKEILYSNFIFIFHPFLALFSFSVVFFIFLSLFSLSASTTPIRASSTSSSSPSENFPIFLVNKIIKFSQTHSRRRRLGSFVLLFLRLFSLSPPLFFLFIITKYTI